LNLYRKRKDLQDLYPEAARGDLLALTEHVAAFLEFVSEIEKLDPEMGSLKKWLGQYKEFIGVPSPAIAKGMIHTLALHVIASPIAAHLPTLFMLTSWGLARFSNLGLTAQQSPCWRLCPRLTVMYGASIRAPVKRRER